ncbi:MAG: Na+/H+ antiporter NhaC family protein [Lachnospiraceae bacterium]
MNNGNRKMSFGVALLIITVMMGTILTCSMVLKSSIITTFFIITIEMQVIGVLLKYPLGELDKAGFEYALKGMSAFFIMLSVGAMVAMWIAAGVVPTLIYVGLKLISPKIVVVMAMILSSVAALATGTSYGSMATVGVAMMGIGASMNIPLEVIAGAVICGAFFGDAMSPCSDTTNITAAATQTPLMVGIKHSLFAQLPAYVISVVYFVVIGLKYGNNTMDASEINNIMEILSANFNIGFVCVIPVIVVIGMLLLRQPTFLSLACGTVSGALVAVLYQKIPLTQLVTYIQKGFVIDTGMSTVDKILNKGGIASMYDMAILVILAMFISGILTYTGVMDAFMGLIVKKVKGPISLVLITMVLAYFLSAFAGSFTLASVLTSTFMLPLYEEKRLKPENLGRVIQGTSAYGGVLIPWNGHAVYAASTLGVPTAAYIPYCIINVLNPIILIIMAVTGITMTKQTDDERKEKEAIS